MLSRRAVYFSKTRKPASAMIALLARGITFVFDEIQRAGLDFQHDLRAVIDRFADVRQQRIDAEKGTSLLGNIVAVGSPPKDVTNIICDPFTPLYFRFSIGLYIYPFSFAEMKQVFFRYNITDFHHQLAIIAASGRFPASIAAIVSRYQQAEKKLLTDRNSARALIYSAILCTKQQCDLKDQFPGLCASNRMYILEGLMSGDPGFTEGEQIEYIARRFKFEKETVSSGLNALGEEHQLLDRRPRILLKKGETSASRWVLVDPLRRLHQAAGIPLFELREDLLPRHLKALEVYESKPILRESFRYLFRDAQHGIDPLELPYGILNDFVLVSIEDGEWLEYDDVQIDFLAILENVQTEERHSVFGSVKRSAEQHAGERIREALVTHVERLYITIEKDRRLKQIPSKRIYFTFSLDKPASKTRHRTENGFDVFDLAWSDFSHARKVCHEDA